jgi:hypothetical protein
MLESDAEVPALVLEQPVVVRAAPATNPVMAADRINVLAVRFIAVPSVRCGLLFTGERNARERPFCWVCRRTIGYLTQNFNNRFFQGQQKVYSPFPPAAAGFVHLRPDPLSTAS